MAAKHWHLTTDPFDVRDFGNKLETKEQAEKMAAWSRRELRRLSAPARRRAVYVVDCMRECVDRDPPGRRLA